MRLNRLGPGNLTQGSLHSQNPKNSKLIVLYPPPRSYRDNKREMEERNKKGLDTLHKHRKSKFSPAYLIAKNSLILLRLPNPEKSKLAIR